MKVIIAGSRDIEGEDLVAIALNLSGFKWTECVSGVARGVDRAGEAYAKRCSIPIKQYPADWDKHGKKAGYLRNVQMAEYADALVAIWDGESKGTKHIIDIMKKLDKPIYVYKLIK